MHLIAKAIRISHDKSHCNRRTTVQDIQDYESLIFLAHTILFVHITLKIFKITILLK